MIGCIDMFREGKSLRDRVKEAVSPKPIRQRLTETMHKLQLQLRRLERAAAELEIRDRTLYDKCVSAVRQNDVSRAKMYAEECAQIRKIAKVSLNSQFALERVVLRLEDVRDFGDIAHTMTPLRSVVGTIRAELANVMPDVSLKLAEVDESLSSMVLDIGEATGVASTMDHPTEEGNKILAEAAALAEHHVKERFPDLPTASREDTVFKPL
jgi:division protein CdvB (Snf7/Vps24/ESCRT-III family)